MAIKTLSDIFSFWRVVKIVVQARKRLTNYVKARFGRGDVD